MEEYADEDELEESEEEEESEEDDSINCDEIAKAVDRTMLQDQALLKGTKIAAQEMVNAAKNQLMDSPPAKKLAESPYVDSEEKKPIVVDEIEDIASPDIKGALVNGSNKENQASGEK